MLHQRKTKKKKEEDALYSRIMNSSGDEIIYETALWGKIDRAASCRDAFRLARALHELSTYRNRHPLADRLPVIRY